MKKDVIVYGMMSWSDYLRGTDNTNAHILRWLEEREDTGHIIFVDFNQYSFKSKLKYYIKNLFFLPNKRTVKWSFNCRLDKTNGKIGRLLTLKYEHVVKIIHELNFTNLEIWSFNPFYIGWTTKFPSAKKVFYAIDDWRQNVLFAGYKDALHRNYTELGNMADVIFTPSKKVKQDIWPSNDKVNVINNGVDVDYYRYPEKTDENIKNKINRLLPISKKPIVGYMGVITPERVDYNLVEYLLHHNADKNFVFAGPVWGGFDSKSLSEQFANVRFIGMVYYQEMSYLLSRFDVCLIPHRLSGFIQSMNPKKLYEYLAAGKPVVATPVAGHEIFKDIINIANSPGQFNDMINRSLKDNSHQQMEKRLSAVLPHSWHKRFEEIKKILDR